jgi:hypothetical protein
MTSNSADAGLAYPFTRGERVEENNLKNPKKQIDIKNERQSRPPSRIFP